MLISEKLKVNSEKYTVNRHQKPVTHNKKRGQPLTLTPNLHMNLPYCFIIRSVCFPLLLNNCIMYKPAG